jgi:hypothetical protein
MDCDDISLAENIRRNVRSRCLCVANFSPNQELHRLWYGEHTGMVMYYAGWQRRLVDDLNPCTTNIKHLTIDTLGEYGF